MKNILCASLLVLAMSAVAFAAPKYRIGIVQQVEHPSLDQVREGLALELKEMGRDGDVGIEYSNGQNSPQLINTICQKFVGSKVNMIIPIATAAAQGAAALTDSIPIVFAAVSDPVLAGLLQNPEAPEGNITGVSDAMPPSMVFDIAQELTPNAKHFGIIYNTAEVNSVSTVNKAKAEMSKRGLTFEDAGISSTAEVISAVNSLAGKVDAIYVPDDNTAASAMAILGETAIEHKIPVYPAVESMVNDGGLASCGLSYIKLGRQLAHMVVKILDGEPIKSCPVEMLHNSDVFVNKDFADRIGVDVSKYVK